MHITIKTKDILCPICDSVVEQITTPDVRTVDGVLCVRITSRCPECHDKPKYLYIPCNIENRFWLSK